MSRFGQREPRMCMRGGLVTLWRSLEKGCVRGYNPSILLVGPPGLDRFTGSETGRTSVRPEGGCHGWHPSIWGETKSKKMMNVQKWWAHQDSNLGPRDSLIPVFLPGVDYLTTLNLSRMPSR